MNRSLINKGDNNVSLSSANHTAKGGKTMPAVPVLEQRDGYLAPENVIDQKNIQRFSLNKSQPGQSTVKPFQLKSATPNKPATSLTTTRSSVDTAIPDAAVIQLAALAADKLNVVGEDHPESKPRWNKEFGLSVAKTHSHNFWLESMFKMDWDGVHKGNEKKDTQGADPTLERVRYMMAAFAIKLESACDKLDLFKPPVENHSSTLETDEVPRPDDSSLVTETQLPDVENSNGPEEIDLDKELKDDFFKTVLALKATTEDLYTQIDIAVIEELHKHLHYLHRIDWPDTKIAPVSKINDAAMQLKLMAARVALIKSPEDMAEPLRDIAFKGKELHDYCQAAGWINDKDNRVIDAPSEALDDAQIQRSKAMHKAANDNRAVPGVWKVGEQHVQDILRILPTNTIPPVSYNLLSRGEFQEIYNEYYPNNGSVTQNKSEVTQYVKSNDHPDAKNTAQLARANQADVVQRIYDDAKDDIDMILCWLLKKEGNEERAVAISKVPALDTIAEDKLPLVLEWLRTMEEQVAPPLKIALSQSNEAFANALLALIANPPQKEETDSSSHEETDTSVEDFQELIGKALEIHVPRVGAMIDEAQERASSLGKKLLVIVGEGHDDPYSRVMVTILVGAMQRLKVNRFYIEATPEQVKQHVEPYKENKPARDDDHNFAQKQHFFHNLYKQGANVTGVDIYKENAEPTTMEDSTERRATLAEQNVNMRNKGIAEAVVKHNESGVMLVGLSHLPGLASDKAINSTYEIVTISTQLIEYAKVHSQIAYNRVLSTTAGLSGMKGLYEGNPPNEPGKITAKDAYAIAEKMVIEVNKK